MLPVDLDKRPRLTFWGASSFPGPAVHHYVMGAIWCLHIYDYRARMAINGSMIELTPGCLTLTPPFAHVVYRFPQGENSHYSLQFELPSPPRARWTLPALTTGPLVERAHERLHPCLELAARDPRRCEVRLWDVLADLATEVDDASAVHDDGLIRRACDVIESRLGEGINVGEVARAVGITPTHLTRLFRRQHQVGTATYLRRRRVQRAHQMLVHGERPIKTIAELVGIPDLQYFNKVIRQELGQSPRALRSGAKTLRVRAFRRS